MTHAQLTNKINHLGYQGFKEAYQRQKEEIVYAAMSFEERLYQLLDAQEIFLKNKRITMNHMTGKSYLAQALANRAVYDGFRVYYTRMPSLLEEIRIARMDGTYTNLLKKYSRFQLLILDDFGVAPVVEDDATNLFEIIEERTNIHSTIITSQLPVSEWYTYLNNNTIADAILDRIVYSSHRIELEGESMRKINSMTKNIEY